MKIFKVKMTGVCYVTVSRGYQEISKLLKNNVIYKYLEVKQHAKKFH